MKLTPEELKAEWDYIVNERIGMLVGSGEATAEVVALAKKEADEHIKLLTESPD